MKSTYFAHQYEEALAFEKKKEQTTDSETENIYVSRHGRKRKIPERNYFEDESILRPPKLLEKDIQQSEEQDHLSTYSSGEFFLYITDFQIFWDYIDLGEKSLNKLFILNFQLCVCSFPAAPR